MGSYGEKAGEFAGRAVGGLLEGLLETLSNNLDQAKEDKRNKQMLAYARSGGIIKRTPPIIPHEARFAHTHICGGTGHGKTQLLHKMILEDMQELKEGRGSIVVIDSQGDLINKLMHIYDTYELRERLILIDPNNIDYPPALNLFDFGLDRLSSYSPLQKERLLNGAVALYEYFFGALLGAELTMRQDVAFHFLAKLLMTVEGATINTMLDFVESPETIRPYLDRVDDTTRRFFETPFFSADFRDTRHQVQARLWGVMGEGTLDRMFSNKKNKLDLYTSLNEGCLLLVNTAKDLLKTKGCRILGRFFIALIGQAIQERAVMPERMRRPTFIYVDEAHDYFDDNLEHMFNEFRKYRAGLIIAHQNLGQLSGRLKDTIMASTKTKMVGGLSGDDARAFAREMGFDVEWLKAQGKAKDWTNFAVTVQNHNVRGSFRIPFGMMDSRRTLTPEEYATLVLNNAKRYASRVPRDDGSLTETSAD